MTNITNLNELVGTGLTKMETMELKEMKDKRVVLGIDIGGTKISAALFDLKGDVLHKEIVSLGDREGSEVMELVRTMVVHSLDLAKNIARLVVAVGACVPGIYDPIRKTVWAPNIRGWDNYPLWLQLTQIVGDTCINIAVESDRSCYILGEVWKGCAHGCSDAIYLSVGTGIGAGILSNGRIITGNRGIAGSVGWMALEPPYDKKYDSWGNFEHYASGNGIARSALESLRKPRARVSILDGMPEDKITAHHVFSAFEKQDPVAEEVLARAVVYWGMAVANLVSIFNPQKVIFGGGVFGPAVKLMDSIFMESKKWAQPLAIREITVEASILKGDAGLIGAGYLAIKSLNASPL
ncbi:ROK family protein [Flavobacteriaceae bacterium F89]|uniref:ROK family protein n=1 Tax=Cerina litoralis TaxID=2874477 RepID=A0AAE3EWG3_9FLAO|nr:ROK family protein [Cerina litoralis]MCG2462143.1 ROK family protein [Cerina litoralis]